MTHDFHPLVDETGRVADLEVERPGASPLRMLGAGGPAREKNALAPLRDRNIRTCLPVLLGAGMGHALRDLLDSLPPPDAVPPAALPLVALADCHPELREAAGIVTEDPRLLVVEDTDPQAALARLTLWQTQHNGLPLQPLVLPFYQRLNREWYGFLREQLEASSRFDFWGRARQPRFRRTSPRLLLITSRYFLVGEVAEACVRQGIEHRLLTLNDDEMAQHEFVTALLRLVVEFQPDAVLTLNHLGVDREGVLTDLLARLELPLASWFVDNPHLVLHMYEGLASPWLAIFTWDQDNIPSLRAQGFQHVFHLPLGTDPERFRPENAHQSAPSSWRANVSFVGNSMVFKVAKRIQRTRFPSSLLRRYRDMGTAFAASEERSVRQFILDRYPSEADAFHALDCEGQLGFETLVTWEATRQYRRNCVLRLLDAGADPLVVGDQGWHIALRQETRPWRWQSALAYYDELPRFYPHSDINFNSTSMQMKGAVNQRVFDVPAAGAFVLTDWRAQMDDLFEPGREIACYRHPDEVPDLVRFYLSHPQERHRITEAGRRRVLACHTWDHRLQTMLAVLKDTFGS